MMGAAAAVLLWGLDLLYPRWAPPPIAQWVTVTAMLLFLPSPVSRDLYPMNGPAWSLFFELAINFLASAVWRRLTNRVLWGLVVVGATGMAATAFGYGSLDVGYSWTGVPGAVARVVFGFSVGLLLYRHPPRWSVNPFLCLTLVAALLWVPAPVRWLYDALVVLVAVPVLVAVGGASEPRAGRGVFLWAGLVSYGIYALHVPFFAWVRALAALAHVGLPYWSGPILLAVLAGGVTVADRIYDRPVREWLTRRTASGAAQPEQRRLPRNTAKLH